MQPQTPQQPEQPQQPVQPEQPQQSLTPMPPVNNDPVAPAPVAPAAPQEEKSENIVRGLLLSLLSIPIGIALWVLLWVNGYIAAIVAFVIAFLAITLYKLGAGGISKKSALLVIGVILLGVALSFLAGMASDALPFYVEGTTESQMDALMTVGFWEFFLTNVFTNGELWESYTTELLISVVFVGLGVFSLIKSLFTPEIDV